MNRISENKMISLEEKQTIILRTIFSTLFLIAIILVSLYMGGHLILEYMRYILVAFVLCLSFSILPIVLYLCIYFEAKSWPKTRHDTIEFFLMRIKPVKDKIILVFQHLNAIGLKEIKKLPRRYKYRILAADKIFSYLSAVFLLTMFLYASSIPLHIVSSSGLVEVMELEKPFVSTLFLSLIIAGWIILLLKSISQLSKEHSEKLKYLLLGLISGLYLTVVMDLVVNRFDSFRRVIEGLNPDGEPITWFCLLIVYVLYILALVCLDNLINSPEDIYNVE